MYGWLPNYQDDLAWDEPKPKTLSKAIIKARGEDGASAMELIRARVEGETGKPHKWVEEGDNYVLSAV